MKSDTTTKLQTILENYKHKQLAMLKIHEQTKADRELFLKNFYQKVSKTIRPCFEELGKLLRSKGHGFEITQKRESVDGHGNMQSASIKLEILPNGFRGAAGARPHISFIANSNRKEVWTQVSTFMSGCAGQRSVYTLEEITEDVVEEEVLSVLTSCFG